MRKIFSYLSILIFIFFPKTIFGQNINKDSLTLEQAIKLTVNNYPLIKQQEQKIKAADYKIEQQKSYYYPNINGSLSYSRIGPVPSFSFGGENLDLYPKNNYDANIDVNELVYDFGRRDKAVDLTKSFKISAEDNVNFVKTNLSYLTLHTFYSILFLDKSLAVKDTQISSLNAHLEITNKKVESGSATDYDALSTQVRISQAENEKIDLLNQLKQEKILLIKLLGVSQDTTINIKGNFSKFYYQANQDSLLNVAFEKRPELKLATDSKNTLTIQKNLASLSDMPALNVNFLYGLQNGFQPNIRVLRGHWAAGISLKVPIFNGNLTNNKEKEAQVNIDENDLNIATIKKNIISDVQQALQNLKSSFDKLNTTKTQVIFAEKSLQRAKDQYKSGVRTNLDLLDAETSLAQARLLYIQDLYRSILSYYQLKKAVGDTIY